VVEKELQKQKKSNLEYRNRKND